jgi:hypothetical protein
LEKIAKSKNTLITSVALAYVLHKAPYVFPIVGGRKVEHLKGNIEALSLRLSKEEIREIDGAYGFDPGFPTNFYNPMGAMVTGPEHVSFNNRAGYFDFVEKPGPIPPHEGPLNKVQMGQ